VRFVVALVSVLAVGACAAQVASWIPVWPLALVEHFRVQMLVGGILVVGACAALRSRYFDAAALATLLHLIWLLPDLSASPRPLPADGRPVRVLLLNVLSSNTRYAEVRKLIADSDADIVALAEIQDTWVRELAPSLAGYSARIEHPRNDNFGLALYSRLPLTGGVEYLGAFPSVVASASVPDGVPVHLVLTHPMPPISGYYFGLMEEQLAAVGARARTLAPHAIILGDFNATPWSRPFRHLVEASGFCDSRAGFGLQTSWVPDLSRVMQLPIDHVLVSCGIGVRDRRIERDVGSDHRPVVVDLVVPRA
jgi:endonuclease/exonuclease/phosphatase (EEP) superfamily protein YafD